LTKLNVIDPKQSCPIYMSSTSFRSISNDFAAFEKRVDTYVESISGPEHNKDDCEAAYEGLYKLSERIKKELKSGNLTKQEKNAITKIRDDRFINSLITGLRKIATHIVSDTAENQGGSRVYLPTGKPVTIPSDVSAGAAFTNADLILPEEFANINHKNMLTTARQRIKKILGQAAI